ncbi:MAG: hypothetical protein PHR35_02185 [Kiritimatiellae bacterium]|nr:hypothetical protein [Kiritimatiellia bacterium]
MKIVTPMSIAVAVIVAILFATAAIDIAWPWSKPEKRMVRMLEKHYKSALSNEVYIVQHAQSQLDDSSGAEHTNTHLICVNIMGTHGKYGPCYLKEGATVYDAVDAACPPINERNIKMVRVDVMRMVSNGPTLFELANDEWRTFGLFDGDVVGVTTRSFGLRVERRRRKDGDIEIMSYGRSDLP